jgi:hypothetical protein
MTLALPAHLGNVIRDLGRFFLQLFAFCGRDRFVARAAISRPTCCSYRIDCRNLPATNIPESRAQNRRIRITL